MSKPLYGVLFYALWSIPLYLLCNLAELSDDNLELVFIPPEVFVPSVLVLVACWWGISHSEPSPSSLSELEEEKRVALKYLKSKCNALAVTYLSENTFSKDLPPVRSHWESLVPPLPSTGLMEKYCQIKVKERERRLLVITMRCEMEQSFFEATFDEGSCGDFLDDLICWEEGMSTKAETVWVEKTRFTTPLQRVCNLYKELDLEFESKKGEKGQHY